MQKKFNIGFVFNLCLICFTANAQVETLVNKSYNPVEKKNVLKINLPALAFKNISFQYERKISNRSSLALGVNTIPFTTLAFQSTFKEIVDNAVVKYEDVKLGSIGIVPEFRYYINKRGGLYGFYIGTFVRYSSNKIELPINYNNNTKTGIFDGTLNSITGGIQLGTQFKLGKSMVLDWWILGPNYGSANGSLNLSANLTPTEQTDISDAIEKLNDDLPFKIIKSYSVNNNGGNVIAKGPWGGLRGLGLSLGYKF